MQETPKHPNDHDLLIRLDEKVTGMVMKLDNLTDDHEDRLGDHEVRLRELEKWRWRSVTLGAAGGTTGAAAVMQLINWLVNN